jgi:putative tricarboxylic transport membrane protein
MRTAEIIIALLFIGLAIVCLFDALKLGISAIGTNGPQAGFILFWLGILQLGMAAIILFQGIRKKKTEETFFINREAAIEAGYVALTSGVFCLLMQLLGTYIAIFLYCIVFSWWLGKCRWFTIIALPVIMALSFYYGFEYGLMIPLPKSPWYVLGLPF